MSDTQEKMVVPPRKTPTATPDPDTTPEPKPDLTPDQQTKYTELLTRAKAFAEIKCEKDNAKSGPLTEREHAWLTRECILRYLRAEKWNVDGASKRLQATLAWRREFGIDELTPDFVSPEQETGKQLIMGYDRHGRPCQYLTPGKQNTQTSPRQLQHLFYMIERSIDIMPPGVENICLMINFKPSEQRKNTSVPISTAREVLSVLQNHYPERLGKALCINVPWIVSGFFRIITPFIDPVTRSKLKFNEDMSLHVPVSQLWSEDWGGEQAFDYDHGVYWPAFNDLCRERREARWKRWVAAGKNVGELEEYLSGGTATSVSGHKYSDFKGRSRSATTATEGENVDEAVANLIAEKIVGEKKTDDEPTTVTAET